MCIHKWLVVGSERQEGDKEIKVVVTLACQRCAKIVAREVEYGK